MNRLLSLILSLLGNLLPYIRLTDKKNILSIILIIAANSIPIIGVTFLKWNPFFILLIYWGESLIIGLFNILKMLISGSIENGKFSWPGFTGATGLSAFFIVHYGMFMLVHGIFIFVFMMLSFSMNIKNSGGHLDPFSAIPVLFHREGSILRSELSAVLALFISHLVTFYIYFIRTGEYNYKKAGDYMMQPYKRIIIMHLTIIFGAIALFLTGFKSVVFIIVWIGMKVFFDLKMHFRDIGFMFPDLQKKAEVLNS